MICHWMKRSKLKPYASGWTDNGIQWLTCWSWEKGESASRNHARSKKSRRLGSCLLSGDPCYYGFWFSICAVSVPSRFSTYRAVSFGATGQSARALSRRCGAEMRNLFWVSLCCFLLDRSRRNAVSIATFRHPVKEWSSSRAPLHYTH